jgi:hypothetical protein
MQACFKPVVRVLLCFLCGWLITLASCNNGPKTYEPPNPDTFAPPIVEPLKFTPWQNMGLDTVKERRVHPKIRPFDMTRLPVRSYDTGAYKPQKYVPLEQKFDISSLPSRDLDIDRLPAKKLDFKVYKLPRPRLIKAAPPRMVNKAMSILELGEAQGLKGDTILSTLTDRDGLVWISTNKGLYRYDGELLWLFSGLPDNTPANNMLQDHKGQIWMTTFGSGVQVVDLKEGLVRVLRKKDGLSDDKTSQIAQDKRNRIWVTAFNTKNWFHLIPVTS